MIRGRNRSRVQVSIGTVRAPSGVVMEIFPQVVISGASGLVGRAVHQHFLANAVSCATLTRHATQPGSSDYFWDPYHFQFRDDMRRLSGIRAAIHLSGDNLTDGRWTRVKKQRIRPLYLADGRRILFRSNIPKILLQDAGLKLGATTAKAKP